MHIRPCRTKVRPPTSRILPHIFGMKTFAPGRFSYGTNQYRKPSKYGATRPFSGTAKFTLKLRTNDIVVVVITPVGNGQLKSTLAQIGLQRARIEVITESHDHTVQFYPHECRYRVKTGAVVVAHLTCPRPDIQCC